MRTDPNSFLVQLCACLLTFLSAADALGQEADLYDHHVHLLSPTLIRDWKATGMAFSRADEAYSDPTYLIENQKLAGAFLISMAHLYVTEEFRPLLKTPDHERRLVAAENDYIAVCVARSPDRFVGFFSVNPLSEYALQEIKRCKSNPNLTGLKLHLPACSIDLDNSTHVARLQEVLSWAAENNVPVLLHLSAGEEISLDKSLWFWRTLIRPHDNLELYLAHLGSAGGYQDASHNILEGHRKLAGEDEAFRSMRIYFDLSGAIIPEGFGEAPPTSDEQCKRLSEQIERIGVKRFLFASDYPVFSIEQTRSSLAMRLSLKPEDLESLISNKSPRFGQAH